LYTNEADENEEILHELQNA